MAIPNPPVKPPSRGNSQSVVPHETAQQSASPRKMHPAVAETMSRYAEVWDENDRLHNANVQLIKDNEVLQRLDQEKSALIVDLRHTLEETQKASDERLHKAEAHHRERLAEAERAKERYLRYAVSISERIQGCISDLEAAHSTSMEMAHTPSDKVLDEVNEAIAAVTKGEQVRP
jgi:hypothetical protein